MSIKSEITRLKDAKSVLRYWLMTKNVTVPGYATLSELTNLLSEVPIVDTEVVKVTVSNHTKASVTAYGMDGPIEIPSQTEGTVSMFRRTNSVRIVPALQAGFVVTAAAKTIAGNAPSTRTAALTPYGAAHQAENAIAPA